MVALPEFPQQEAPRNDFEPQTANSLLAALQDAHQRLELTTTELDRLAGRALTSPAQFSSARLRLSQANRERKTVLQRIFNFCSAASAEQTSTLRRLQLREVELCQQMSDVIGRWTIESALRDWEAYCCESRGLRERLMETVAAEKATLYPLLRRYGSK